MFHGSIVALVTPMKRGGEIDYDALTRLVEMQIMGGTSAIVMAGTTGESATLTQDEKIHILKHAIKVSNDRIPIIAGTGANGTQSCLHLTKLALEAGADAALIMTPSYNKPTQEGLYQHYKSIAEAVHIPIILYNIPTRTAVDLLPETVERLSHFSNIIGIKEGTGSMNRVMDVLERCGDQLDVYSGDDINAKDTLKLGGKGVISVSANFIPHEIAELCKAGLSGDFATMKSIHKKLLNLHNSLFLETNPIPVKWVMSQLGYLENELRLPMVTLSTKHHDPLLNLLKGLNLLK